MSSREEDNVVLVSFSRHGSWGVNVLLFLLSNSIPVRYGFAGVGLEICCWLINSVDSTAGPTRSTAVK